MHILRCLSVTVIVGLLGGLSAMAAENPMAAFPKDTGVMVRLKHPQKTLKKAGDLAVKVDRKEGVKVQFAMPVLGMAISNPQLTGVDLDADWWLGVFPVENGEPGVVFCIPATDAAALEKAVTGDYQFLKFDKWVLYTEHAPTAAMLKTHLAKKGESISTLLDESANAVWDGGDFSVFVNVPHLVKVYQGPFEQGIQQVNNLIDQLPAMVPPQQQRGMNIKAVTEMYATAFKTLVQGVKDAQGCAGGLLISADGISVDEYVSFSADSATAKALAKHESSKLELLEKLPANRLAYGSAKMDMGGMIKWGMKYSLEMFTEGDTEKEKQFKKLMTAYETIEFGQMAMAFGFGDMKQGAMRMSTLMDIKPSDKVRELTAESSKLMSDANINGMKMQMTYKTDAETYGDLKADVARVKYEVDPQLDPLQIQAKMNEVLYGPDGMVTRTFYLKDRVAQAVGGGKADAQNLLDALDGKNAAGSQTAFQATRKQLLSKANLIGMLNLPGTLAGGMKLAVESGVSFPFDDDDIKSVRGEPSYLGFSLAVEQNALRTKTVVPLPQMQGVARFIRLVEAAEQQGL